MSKVEICSTPDEVAKTAAELVVTLSAQAVAERGRFTISLSGGSTPKTLYTLLATDAYRNRIDWSKWYVFWGDERCVPPDHVDSDYRMARESLLAHAPIPAAQIHRIQGEIDPAQAANAYDDLLHQFFERDGLSRFDLMLLGMGDDGHTASLFPHTAALEETVRWAIPNFVEKLNVWRVTLTQTALNASRQVLFLVTGAAKAERLHQVLNGPYQPDELPSQLVDPDNGDLLWLVDAQAASQLNQ